MPMDVDGIPERTPEDFKREERKRIAQLTKELENIPRVHRGGGHRTLVPLEVQREQKRQANKLYRDKMNPERLKHKWFIRVSDGKLFQSIKAIQDETTEAGMTYGKVYNNVRIGKPVQGQVYREATDAEVQRYTEAAASVLQSQSTPFTEPDPTPVKSDDYKPERTAPASKVDPTLVKSDDSKPEPEPEPEHTTLIATSKADLTRHLKTVETSTAHLRVIYIEGRGDDVAQLVRQILTR